METDHTGDDFSAAKRNDCPAVDFRPAKRWGASKQDVWSVINEGAEASRIKPCVNLRMLSVWMAFLNPGDEVMLFEPYFDQSLDYIHMAGGVIRCVPLRPPAKADIAICSSPEWTTNFVELEQSITSRTKMIVLNTRPSQEAAAAVYEQSLYNGFWSQTRTLVREKMIRLCQVFQKLDLPYTIPEGGYFVLVNLAKVQIPREYRFPPHIRDRRRDFLLAWFLIMELGVAAIPASEYYSPEHACLGKNYLRFAICQNDDILN
ncbi:kynurenine--oxoglutarate transaminase 3 [Aspergillus tubingensis]|nr:kynurenine--oxoglutarate transaminase 3 [Aspergillus tubingensis]